MSGASGREQLDVALADLEQHRLDALLLDGLAVLLGHAERSGRARSRRRGPRRRRRCGRCARTRGRELVGYASAWRLAAAIRGRAAARRRSSGGTRVLADDALDVRALEHLLLQQRRARARRAASRCVADQRERAAVGAVGELGLLLVARGGGCRRRARSRRSRAGASSARCPSPYSVTIARLISSTRCRSSEAPVVTEPKTICSATRPPSSTSCSRSAPRCVFR